MPMWRSNITSEAFYQGFGHVTISAMRILLTFILMAAVGCAEDQRTVAEARYLGVILSIPGSGNVAELNPWSHFYACFRVGEDLMIGEMFSWRWNTMFRGIHAGQMMKVSYDRTHMWVDWPTGKTVQFKQDASKPEIVAYCKRISN